MTALADTDYWSAVGLAGEEGDSFRVLNAGDSALEWRLRAIDSAVDSIAMQTFLWDLDEVGALVARRLLAAAQRGVRVRIMLDDSFTANLDTSYLTLDAHPAVDIRVFNPYQRRSSRAAARVALNLADFSRLDHRMHNKLLLVDGRVAIAGGRNIADEYFGYNSLSNFRDMELLATGPTTLQLGAAFDEYWNSPWSFELAGVMGSEGPIEVSSPSWATPKNQPYRSSQLPAERAASWEALKVQMYAGNAQVLIDRPPLKEPGDADELPLQVGKQLLDMLNAAREDIWLISAYLIPTDKLSAAIEAAIDRGVTIRILTNSLRSNNHLSAHAAYYSHLVSLLQMGVQVYEVRYDARDRERYMNAPADAKTLGLHAKVLLADDDELFVGSANLDPRSLRLNTEMGLRIVSPQLNKRIRELLEPDFDPANAWHLQLEPGGGLSWRGDGEVLYKQPGGSAVMRLEDWFLSHLPLDAEM